MFDMCGRQDHSSFLFLFLHCYSSDSYFLPTITVSTGNHQNHSYDGANWRGRRHGAVGVSDTISTQASLTVARGNGTNDSARSSLDADRLIRIAVGTGKHAKAFNIQQALLETVSEYFVKALRNKRLGAHPEPGVLRFPEHCVDAWEALCYWIFRHELPATAYEHHYILAVRCWCLGDKYAIDGFQDEALLILLREANSNNLKWEVIEEAVLNSRPGTQLRRLMAMEVKSQAIDF